MRKQIARHVRTSLPTSLAALRRFLEPAPIDRAGRTDAYAAMLSAHSAPGNGPLNIGR